MPMDVPRLPQMNLNRRAAIGAGAVFLGSAAWSGIASGAQIDRPPIWTVRKSGKNIFVLGESLPRTIDWHAPDIEGLLCRCGHLWTETNQIYREPVGTLVKTFGMSASAPTLKLLSAKQTARLERAATVATVSLDDLAGARPWLIGATLEDSGYKAIGLTGKSANTVLHEQASKANIPVSSEFAVKDDVFSWFGGMSPIQETQFLCYAVDGVLLGRSGSEWISSNWLSGRPGPATKFVEHVRRVSPQLHAKLMVHRNIAWVARFEAMLQDPKPTMVVVGLYHLVGPENLLFQLRKAGFEVVGGVNDSEGRL